MGSKIEGIDHSDLILLIGFNPRTTSPVLNARLRRAAIENKAKIAVIGPGEELLYDYIHLGNSTKTLEDIANDKHPFCKLLKKAKLPMLMVSSNILRGKEGKNIERVLCKICVKNKIIKEKIGWNGYNVVLNSASEAGAYDLGLASNITEEERKKPMKLLYLLGEDDHIDNS